MAYVGSNLLHGSSLGYVSHFGATKIDSKIRIQPKGHTALRSNSILCLQTSTPGLTTRIPRHPTVNRIHKVKQKSVFGVTAKGNTKPCAPVANAATAVIAETQESEVATSRDVILHTLFEFLKPDALLVLASVTFALTAVIANLLVSPALGNVIDIMTASAKLTGSMDIARSNLFRALGVLLGTYLVNSASLCLHLTFAEITSQRLAARLRKDGYASVLQKDVQYFDTTQDGDIVSRLGQDVESVQALLKLLGSSGLRAVLEVVGTISILLYLSPKLACVLLTIIPISAFMVKAMSKQVVDASINTQESIAVAASTADEILENMSTVVSFNAEQRELERYTVSVGDTFTQSMKVAAGKSLLESANRVANALSICTVIVLGGWMALHGSTTVGTCYSFFVYSFTLSFALNTLAGNAGEFASSIGASMRTLELAKRGASQELHSTFTTEGKKLEEVDGKLKVEGVKFRYSGREQWALGGVDLEVAAGDVVALVGPSGCGKSTLASMLLRLYDPQQGQILLDGVALSELNKPWLREQIGVVSQTPSLIAGSIRDNIRYGTEGATEQEVEEAARVANAHNFISGLPEGYDTIIGERGMSLSGGQQQRVAIARAVLKNPKILILDEATSALDVESEELVANALRNLMQGRTTIIIAHRLSTVKEAKNILVMEKGTIREQGSHNQLMKVEGGLYRQLVRTFEDSRQLVQ